MRFFFPFPNACFLGKEVPMLSRSPRFLTVLLTIIASLGIPGQAQAAWVEDGTPVCTEAYSQNGASACSDGAGGAIIAWIDRRDGLAWGTHDVYAQRVYPDGTLAWAPAGVAVCDVPEEQSSVRVVSDGYGGAIIIWADLRDAGVTKIYAQRLAPDGSRLWNLADDGVLVSTMDTQSAEMTSDGHGGAIVTWGRDAGGQNMNLYAQRLDPSGTLLWDSDGVEVCNDPSHQSVPRIAPDGLGGAYIAWNDYRYSDIVIRGYANHVNASGTVTWGSGGLRVSETSASMGDLDIAADGLGGIVVSYNTRVGFDPTQVDAQRIDPSGARLWGSMGLEVCRSGIQCQNVSLSPDGNGGTYIAWEESRPGAEGARIQYVSADGSILLETNGMKVTAHNVHQGGVCIARHLDGGAVIGWLEIRDNPEYDLFAQRIDGAGQRAWGDEGTALCETPDFPRKAEWVQVTEGNPIIHWCDWRDGDYLESDIYAMRPPVTATTTPPRVLMGLTIEANHPNPFNPRTTIRYSIPEDAWIRIQVFDARGRLVRTLVDRRVYGGPHAVVWNGCNDAGLDLPNGVYLSRLEADGQVAHGRMTLVR